MERRYLLPEGATYYKANLHCHTCISDGKLTPEEIKELYKERGYSVVAFTDHRIYRNHTELNDDGFLAIAAMETDLNEVNGKAGEYNRTRTYHINWYDQNPDIFREEKSALKQPLSRYHDMEYINGYVKEMRRLGFLACYNHPYWSLQTCREYDGLQGFWGMEIYNHGCELDGMYGFHPQAYDEMLRAGRRLFCVAADDNHNPVGPEDPLCDSFGGYVMIGAGEFTYGGIMEALAAGNFYSVAVPDGAGAGPEIRELYIEDGRLYVKCGPAKKIYMKTMGRDCGRAVAPRGECITEAVFPISGREGYVRLEVSDAAGCRTFSNAYFL